MVPGQHGGSSHRPGHSTPAGSAPAPPARRPPLDRGHQRIARDRERRLVRGVHHPREIGRKPRRRGRRSDRRSPPGSRSARARTPRSGPPAPRPASRARPARAARARPASRRAAGSGGRPRGRGGRSCPTSGCNRRQPRSSPGRSPTTRRGAPCTGGGPRRAAAPPALASRSWRPIVARAGPEGPPVGPKRDPRPQGVSAVTTGDGGTLSVRPRPARANP